MLDIIQGIMQEHIALNYNEVYMEQETGSVSILRSIELCGHLNSCFAPNQNSTCPKDEQFSPVCFGVCESCFDLSI